MAQPHNRPQTKPAPKRGRLQEVARLVRRDAQHQPERYLKESEVPHGGE